MNPPGNVAGSGSALAGAPGTSAGAGASASAGIGSSAGGTSGGSGGCGTESFAAIYQSIFANKAYNCAGALCHGRVAMDFASVGDLSLSSAAVAYTQLVGKSSDSMKCPGKTRVIAGDPKNSLLVQKLRGDTTACGAPMPVGADQITDDELKRISDWISAGACNN
jgi:hypothetical protein